MVFQGLFALWMLFFVTVDGQLISEFQPNPIGNNDPDQTKIELSGTPGESFSGWIVSIETDGINGSVDRSSQVSGTFDANGLLTVEIPDLENPSFTLILSSFYDERTTDIDPENTGSVDIDVPAVFGTVFDAINIPDNPPDAVRTSYASDLGGIQFGFTRDEPRLMFRDGSVGDWYAVNDPDNGKVYDSTGTDVTAAIFDTDPTDGTGTFGSINPSVDGGGGGGTSLAIVAVDASKTEGDAGSTAFTFTVTRSGDLSGSTTVDYAVTGDADVDDFGGVLPSGTVTFASGDATQTIAIDVSGDVDTEPNEVFTVTLSNASGGATITTDSAQGTIQNDDGIISLIHDVQGSGLQSSLVGQTVTVQGVVVGDFQDGGEFRDLDGFFLQEEDSDADADLTTSEGIFIYDGLSPSVDVNIGDLVKVTGVVTEFGSDPNTLTELASVSLVSVLSSDNPLPTPLSIDLSSFGTEAARDAALESVEGMLVTMTGDLIISEMFNFDRFGQVTLLKGDRAYQFTQRNTPNVDGYASFLDELKSRQIIYDDGRNSQYPFLFDPFGGFGPSYNTDSAPRMADTVTDLTGVLSFAFGEYRVFALGLSDPLYTVEFVSTNPRPPVPTSSGEIKIVSTNVQNFFTTLQGQGTSGPNGADPRGAETPEEYTRQLDKLVSGLTDLSADVYGLVELENDFAAANNGGAIGALVNALNAAEGTATFDYVYPGRDFVGTDAIAVGFIYKPASVTKLGDAAILDSSIDSNFIDTKNRPVVAQSFGVGGECITLAVTHLKSKGSACDEDPTPDDGAGNCDATRTSAAAAMATWLSNDPTGQGCSSVAILGDLNAYAKESPITTLETEGYVNVEASNEDAYSFVFDGQIGTLDYFLINDINKVDDVSIWHINEDEADALDYNIEIFSNTRNSSWYDSSAVRHSDHSPLLVGVTLTTSGPPPSVSLSPSISDSPSISLVEGLFPFRVEFAACSVGASSLTLNCTFSLLGSSGTVTVDEFSYQLKAKDCTGAAPSGVNLSNGAAELEKVISVTDTVANDAANNDELVEFCLEAQIGTGGALYAIAKQNIAIDFDKDGEFTTVTQIVATEVGGQQTVDVDFEVTATVCDSSRNDITDSASLESGDDLRICIDVDDAATIISSVDTLTISKASTSSSFDAILGGVDQSLTSTSGDGTGAVTVLTVLDTSFFEDDDPANIEGTVTLQISTIRNLQGEEVESMKKEVVDLKYRLLQDVYEDDFNLKVDVVADKVCGWLCWLWSLIFG